MAKAKHSFRNGKSQAKQLAAEMSRHGQSRHAAKATGTGGIQGLGTERISKQVYSQYAQWLHHEHRGDLRTSGRDAAVHYLEQRAEAVGQSMLNQERQALDRLQQHLHGQNVEALPRVRSELTTIKTGRAYSAGQVSAICAAQTDRNAIMTELAQRCGLRAHEGFTIRPVSEQPASAHRTWSPDRFTNVGGKRPDGEIYTVCGKGGLIREIFVPRGTPAGGTGRDLVAWLEAYRLPTVEKVTDRGIHYVRAYGIGAGQAWSQSVSAASKRVLGFSNGGHGFRHSYAQARVSGLQAAGRNYHDAWLIVSQELGHFREAVIDAYLR